MNWRCRLRLHRWRCTVAWGDANQPYRFGEERCDRCPKVRRFRFRPSRWEVYCEEWPVMRTIHWSRRRALCALAWRRALTAHAYEAYRQPPARHWAMRML